MAQSISLMMRVFAFLVAVCAQAYGYAHTCTHEHKCLGHNGWSFMLQEISEPKVN